MGWRDANESLQTSQHTNFASSLQCSVSCSWWLWFYGVRWRTDVHLLSHSSSKAQSNLWAKRGHLHLHPPALPSGSSPPDLFAYTSHLISSQHTQAMEPPHFPWANCSFQQQSFALLVRLPTSPHSSFNFSLPILSPWSRCRARLGLSSFPLPITPLRLLIWSPSVPCW